ncbi:hypothetical protein D3C71_1673530 [compost metagenome]
MAHDQHAGCAGAADEFVRRENDGVDLRIGRRRHPDGQIRRAASIVPQHLRARALHQPGDGGNIRNNAGHVGGRRQRADNERIVRGLQCRGQLGQVRPAFRTFFQLNDVGAAFAPGQDV